ncbi:MAG: class I SAM-dependent methyltransferase [Chloroflexi bacterium]|jgi:2-polyprenyl-3-methyl-5-hydroxy-6-metoxy-1,4-benzoquinol methylase|nr:class I SAM-dependent methyltransferase [Chloroflexota bacterium]
MERKSHWDNVYQHTDPSQVGWYRPHLENSLQFIEEIALEQSAQIIDIGGGCSTLVDDLLDRGFDNVTILDLSSYAIEIAKNRLGNRSSEVTWIEADVTKYTPPPNQYDLWHDRAVFHFLTSPEDRNTYFNAVWQSLKPNGNLIIATFSPEAPPKCSGLDLVRYTPDSLCHEFEEGFHLIQNLQQEHVTPLGVRQPYIYCHFRKNEDTREAA